MCRYVVCGLYRHVFFPLWGWFLWDVPSRGFEWRICSSYVVCIHTFMNGKNLHNNGSEQKMGEITFRWHTVGFCPFFQIIRKSATVRWHTDMWAGSFTFPEWCCLYPMCHICARVNVPSISYPLYIIVSIKPLGAVTGSRCHNLKQTKKWSSKSLPYMNSNDFRPTWAFQWSEIAWIHLEIWKT